LSPEINAIDELGSELYDAQKVPRVDMNTLDSGESDEVNGISICKVLILSDSSYLVKGIRKHIWKWRRDGFRNAKGQPVVNGKAFKELDEFTQDVEAVLYLSDFGSFQGSSIETEMRSPILFGTYLR